MTEITHGPTTFRDDLCHSLVDSVQSYLLVNYKIMYRTCILLKLSIPSKFFKMWFKYSPKNTTSDDYNILLYGYIVIFKNLFGEIEAVTSFLYCK